MSNKNSKPVGQNGTYNIYKMVHVPTNETFYCKAIVTQCPNVDKFLNKLNSIAVKHPTPGYMYRRLRDTLRSEWGVMTVAAGLDKMSANELKRELISNDSNTGSTFMVK